MTEHEKQVKEKQERWAKAHVQSNVNLQKRIEEVLVAVSGASMRFDGYREIEAARIEGTCRIVAAEIGRGKSP